MYSLNITSSNSTKHYFDLEIEKKNSDSEETVHNPSSLTNPVFTTTLIQPISSSLSTKNHITNTTATAKAKRNRVSSLVHQVCTQCGTRINIYGGWGPAKNQALCNKHRQLYARKKLNIIQSRIHTERHLFLSIILNEYDVDPVTQAQSINKNIQEYSRKKYINVITKPYDKNPSVIKQTLVLHNSSIPPVRRKRTAKPKAPEIKNKV